MKTHATADIEAMAVDPSISLLNASTLEPYHRALTAGIQQVIRQWQGIQSPCTGISPHTLNQQLQAVDLDVPLGDLDAAMAEAARLYLRDAVYFHHPYYAAHLNCPVMIPALAAEAVLSAVNASLDTWDQSCGASLIEQKIMDWTAERCGLDPDRADGVMTSGGTQSNLMAMLLARDIAVQGLDPGHSVRHHGLPTACQRMRILASDTSHFSIQKAASLLGLGEAAVITLATDDRGCLRPRDVEQALIQCRHDGLLSIALVATAGTTDFGSIDPLPELAAICGHHQLRLHVDAAYGGGLLVSPRYRDRLAGIERADSITIDFHKSWFQPLACSALLVRDRGDWQHLTYHADYLNPLSQTLAGRPNLINKSLQTSRRFDAFKIWLSLRSAGPDAIGTMFDTVIELARDGDHWLRQQPDFELPSPQPPMLSTLLLRYRPPGPADEAHIDALNQRIRDALLASGRAVIGGTRRQQRHYLKFTLLNPGTRLCDLQALVQLIRQQADQLLALDDMSDEGAVRP